VAKFQTLEMPSVASRRPFPKTGTFRGAHFQSLEFMRVWGPRAATRSALDVLRFEDRRCRFSLPRERFQGPPRLGGREVGAESAGGGLALLQAFRSASAPPRCGWALAQPRAFRLDGCGAKSASHGWRRRAQRGSPRKSFGGAAHELGGGAPRSGLSGCRRFDCDRCMRGAGAPTLISRRFPARPERAAGIRRSFGKRTAFLFSRPAPRFAGARSALRCPAFRSCREESRARSARNLPRRGDSAAPKGRGTKRLLFAAGERRRRDRRRWQRSR
jgi:hypothetical protein